MTEYDYSPAAYQRHIETQNRIAKWVDHTEAHHNVFCTPFGARSDVGDDDLDGMSEADEAIPSGASAGGWYESKRRTRGGYASAPPPPPLPLLYHPQPSAPSPVYPPALASAPVGYNYPPPGHYMSPPGSPQQIIIQTMPKHRSSHHHHSGHHHGSRSSSSEARRKSKKTKMFALPPPGSAGPPMQIQPSSYGYPGPQPPPGTYTYSQSPVYYPSNSPYPSQPHVYSPPSSGQSMMSPAPGPSPYYPQSGGYVIVPPKGQHVRVMYA
ncbi:hypothetical protein BT96DRAFT_939848 [Gymnopus androsaceus JB14]|uniref:Uncharacterized protein n=1 Tax=Gymnopus androsaceus JB14 TaxID=1447944 RepID=A0A6A4HLN4_9AGAR|nr:hypothetical protein BT96DRAFT_939848 [Gymnopus androsaceus JB14]